MGIHLTKEEAEQKMCPHLSYKENSQKVMCDTSCMEWKWSDGWNIVKHPLRDNNYKGFCGMKKDYK